MESMATTKKRKVDQEQPDEEDQTLIPDPQNAPSEDPTTEDTPDEDDEDVGSLLEPLSREQLISLLRSAASSSPSTLAEIRRLANLDPSHRKIFVHGLNWSTTAETLRSFFSQHGEIDDCRVVMDRASGKSKGYGFVLFRDRQAARKALRAPQNLIDGRMTACQLASTGPTGNPQSQAPAAGHYQQGSGTENAPRKIYVGNVSSSVDGGRLLEFFSRFGEIEEGPLGFDRHTGKPKGFALFIYRTAEGAKKALEEPNKNFEGHVLYCQKASDGPRHKGGSGGSAAAHAASAYSGGGSGGYGSQVSGAGYGASGSAGGYNGELGMSAQGMMGGSVPFGQGMQANAAALAMLAAAGQNPAAFGMSPALVASLNPALAAAMSAGTPSMSMQAPISSQGYAMGSASGYQNVGYQAPSQAVNQGGGVSYQAAPIGQATTPRPQMGPMGGYGPH